MPTTIFTGNTRALKSRMLLEIARALAKSDRPIIIVVPAQFALQAEIDILSGLSLTGSFQIQVLPPQRLYARVFERTGQLSAIRVNDQGRAMLLHMQAKKIQDELSYYGSVAESPGFAKRAMAQIAEFKRAGMGPADVLNLASAAQSPALSNKLADLSRLYEAYEAAAEGRLIDPDDEMQEALSRFKNAPDLQHATVMLFGFDLITAEISALLTALSETAESASMFLPLGDESQRDGRLYEPVRRSLKRFCITSAEEGEKCRVEQVSSEEDSGGPIRHFEKELFAWPLKPYPGEQSAVSVAIALSPRREAEACAASIRKLVTQEGYRYREIAVACQNLDRYHDALIDAFALYGVPIFLAESRPADHHPLARCLNSALKILARGWQSEDVAANLKTGYMPIKGDEADQLLNYAYENGLRGRRLKDPLPGREDPGIAHLESIRARAVAPLLRLSERISTSRKAKDRLEAVYLFLEEIEAHKSIEAERAYLLAEGFPNWAAEGDQVFSRIISCLDQILDLAPGNISVKDLSSLVAQALTATEVRALPQTGDAVSGGSADHMKSAQVRALFLLGATEQELPPSGGLLSDAEGQELAAREGSLWHLTDRERMQMQRLSIKSLISLTGERLMISYPAADESGEVKREGTIITFAKQIFLKLSMRKIQNHDGAFLSRASAIAHLPGALRENPDDPEALSAARALSKTGDGEEISKLKSALTHRIHSEFLPEEVADQLYHGLLSVSISRLERYAECPFKHFADYGLRPLRLSDYEISYADAGNFYHRAIEVFTAGEAVLTEAEAHRRMDEITDGLLEKMLGGPLLDSAVVRAEVTAFKSVARRAAGALILQGDGSQFETFGVEMEFGKDGRLLRIGDAILTGRIDRIDRFKGEDGDYLRVIDYKTGGKPLSLSDIYHGLSMQLTLYLAAALNSLGGKPAGAFYFAVKDPIPKTNATDQAEIETLRTKELRMDGLVLRDENVVRAMAAEPEKAIKVRFKKDDTLYADAKVIPEIAFSRLIERSSKMAEEKLMGIKKGDTSVSPARSLSRDACKYCDYAALCQWDEALPGASKRRFDRIRDEDVIKELERE